MLLDGADQGEVAGFSGDSLAFLTGALGDDSADAVAERLGLGDGACGGIGGVAIALLLQGLLIGRLPVGEQRAEARGLRRWRRGRRLTQTGGKKQQKVHERRAFSTNR